MRTIFYTLLAAITLNANAMTPPQEEELITIDYGQAVVQHHPGLEACEWAYDGEQFTVFYDDKEFTVQPAFVDPALRNLTKGQLISLLQYGYLYINRLDNDEFTIKIKMRLEGGNPRRKREPLVVLLVGGAIIGTFLALDYLCNGTTPAIRSEGNRVNIVEPTCVIGGGLPRAIIGGGAQKGPWMQTAPRPQAPAAPRPMAPKAPGAPQAPRPAPRPVAPIPPCIPHPA